jgi:hypothetical protein
MAIRPRPAICERARVWSSARLDAELSEFEEALLRAHLSRCSACSEYEESIRGAVFALRDAPLEQLEHPVSVPSRRRAVLRPAALARAAAVVAVAVGIATVLTSQPAQRFPATPTPKIAPTDNRDLVEARALRVAQLGALPSSAVQMGTRGAVLQRGRI